jgi:phytanoyl-CoA hydroxylase
MTYIDFQRAQTQLLRNTKLIMGLDVPEFLGQFQLTETERQNLLGLAVDYHSRKFVNNMADIRWGLAMAGLPTLSFFVEREVLKRLFLDEFDPQGEEISSWHLSYRFSKFLLDNPNAREALANPENWQDSMNDGKGQSGTGSTVDLSPLITDIVRFENAQCHLRIPSFARSNAPPKSGEFTSVEYEILTLKYDIPQLVRNLRSKKSRPTVESMIPANRALRVLIINGKSKEHLSFFEIDEVTLEYLDWLKQSGRGKGPAVNLPTSTLKQLAALGLIESSAFDKPASETGEFYKKDAILYEKSIANSEKQKILQEFQEKGFVKIRHLFLASEVETIRKNLVRYQRDVVETAHPDDRFQPSHLRNTNKYASLGRIDHYDDFFAELAKDLRLKTLAETLIKSKVSGCNIQFFNIIPGCTPPTPPHQDALNLLIKDGALINIWLPLSRVNGSNGCLHYIPGSHKRGRRYHEQRNGRGPDIISPYTPKDCHNEIAIHANLGDVIIHHGFTIHGSEANRSDAERWALGFPFVEENKKRVTRDEWLSGAL